MELHQKIKVRSFLDLDENDIRQCTQQEGQAIFMLAPKETHAEAIPQDLKEALNGDFLLQILRARLKVSKVSCTPYLEIFLSLLMDNPGKSVMWANTLLCLARSLGRRDLTLYDFVNAFPHGFPTADAMHTLWDEQKNSNAPNGNLLDEGVLWTWEFREFEIEVYNKRVMDLS